MGNPCLDDLFRRIVVTERVDQDLPPAIELASKDPVGAMRFIERAPAVFDGGAEGSRRVLVLETLDPSGVGSREDESNHRVVETTIDEIIDDCT